MTPSLPTSPRECFYKYLRPLTLYQRLRNFNPRAVPFDHFSETISEFMRPLGDFSGIPLSFRKWIVSSAVFHGKDGFRNRKVIYSLLLSSQHHQFIVNNAFDSTISIICFTNTHSLIFCSPKERGVSMVCFWPLRSWK